MMEEARLSPAWSLMTGHTLKPRLLHDRMGGQHTDGIYGAFIGEPNPSP